MRRITPEERELFLAAFSGRLPVKKPAKPVTRKAAAKSAQHAAETAHKPVYRAGSRQVSEDELDLFLEAIGKRPRKTAAVLPVILTPVLPVKPRGPKQVGGGIDGNTKRRLEKGEIAPTAKLDLHGMTEATAHGALLTFLHAAHRRGDRLVLIVTGKGPILDPHGYGGVLRQNVPRWLEEAPMASIIAEKRWAHRRHGGEGALYVYFKKR